MCCPAKWGEPRRPRQAPAESMVPQRTEKTMSGNSRRLLLLMCLPVLAAWPALVRAETKHPAEEMGIRSVSGEHATTVKFVNQSGNTLKVYWLDYAGARKLYQTLNVG